MDAILSAALAICNNRSTMLKKNIHFDELISLLFIDGELLLTEYAHLSTENSLPKPLQESILISGLGLYQVPDDFREDFYYSIFTAITARFEINRPLVMSISMQEQYQNRFKVSIESPEGDVLLESNEKLIWFNVKG